MRSWEARLAVLVAALVTVGYLIGSGRAFGYDSAVTMHNFVRTQSLADAFTKQVVANNHPVLSFLEHLIFSILGTSSEVSMRVLPAAFAGVAAGLLTWWAAGRWGIMPAIGVAVTFGTSPLITTTAREVRGYSLLVLATVVLGLVTVAPSETPSSRRRILAAGAIAIGIATHLSMLAVAAVACLWLVRAREWESSWRLAFVGATTVGLLPYAVMSGTGRGGRVFRAEFPIDLARELLGGSFGAAVVLGSTIALGGWGALREGTPRPARDCLLAIAAMIVLAWLVGPTDLYPRFFIWLVPPVALFAGSAIRRFGAPVLVAVLVAAGLSLTQQVPGWSEDPLPTRVVGAAIASRSNVCSAGFTAEALEYYAPRVPRVAPPVPIECDEVVIVHPSRVPAVRQAVLRTFPVSCDIAGQPGEAELFLRSGQCPDGAQQSR